MKCLQMSDILSSDSDDCTFVNKAFDLYTLVFNFECLVSSEVLILPFLVLMILE
jgi:hypothetical protein